MKNIKRPECSRNLKQQFIGSYHCKCGMSYMKGTGYFQRTPDMIFCLERKTIGKKIKQIPVIKYKTKS